ncbi:hypothetical protein PUN28_019713 [Cardiocondyla obscurior]|uniref:Uncharacterized protein n=1 Tax=Cardiocondyla obscurior TaxID=286306 RepID=A0AAW2EC40_9HYME
MEREGISGDMIRRGKELYKEMRCRVMMRGKMGEVLDEEGRVGKKTPGYMVMEELQRDKLRTRMRRRAWGFEKRIEEGRESGLARKCWE